MQLEKVIQSLVWYQGKTMSCNKSRVRDKKGTFPLPGQRSDRGKSIEKEENIENMKGKTICSKETQKKK